MTDMKGISFSNALLVSITHRQKYGQELAERYLRKTTEFDNLEIKYFFKTIDYLKTLQLTVKENK